MSRDFTPCELFFADSQYNMRDMKIVFTDQNGNEKPLFTKEEEAKRKYPELIFLFDDFNDLFLEYNNSKKFHELAKEMETELKKEEIWVISEFAKSKKFTTKTIFETVDTNYLNYSAKTVIRLWFYGKLDKNFYYSTDNNLMLKEYIIYKVKENSKGETSHE